MKSSNNIFSNKTLHIKKRERLYPPLKRGGFTLSFDNLFSYFTSIDSSPELNSKIFPATFNLSLNSSTYSLFSKLEQFQPKRFDTNSKTIYDNATEFKMAVIEKFQSDILSEELEFGLIGNTIKNIKAFIAINKDYTINAITQYGIDNFKNVDAVYAVLYTLAHMDYHLIEPGGATFALTATMHPNVDIKDFAIQCFDMWASIKSLGYLKIIEIESPWLNDYLQEVIVNIESKHV